MLALDRLTFRRNAALFATILAALLPGEPARAQVGSWTAKAPMPAPRCCLAAAGVGRTIFALGGEPPTSGPNVVYGTVEAYDAATNAWTAKAAIPTPRYAAGAAALNGVIYMVGGSDSSNLATGTVEAYDIQTNTWTKKASLPTPRSGLTLASVNGILYAIGGVKSGFINTDYNTVEAYDPASDSWTTKAPMPTKRYSCVSGVIKGLIYVAGGGSTLGPSVSETLATVEVYDPATNSWTTKEPMPTARWAAASGVAGGELVVVGGLLSDHADSATAAAEAYNPQTDAWRTVDPMPSPRGFIAAGTAQDVIYVVGGYPALALNEAFSPFLAVAVDIKPGDSNNVINIKSAGVVPVAILGSPTFDATTVDPTTVTLAGAPVALRGNGKPMTAIADVNNDGFPDLLVYFHTQKLNLTPADTEAVLYGKTFSGQAIRGSDKVKIIAPPATSPQVARTGRPVAP